MEMQAKVWYKQHRLEEARSEALRAADAYENLGATKDVEACTTLLREIYNTGGTGRRGYLQSTRSQL